MTAFQAAHSFGEYQGTLRKLIHLFKYDGVQPLAVPLGRMLVSALPLELRFDCIVPMPLHWRKQWERGFNQAELLARVCSRRSGVPVVMALRRTRATKPQAGLRAADRRKNVQQAFRVPRPSRISGAHVLLIDDVLTTGSTVNAGAVALQQAGAKRITVLTLARADRRKAFMTGN